VKLRVTPCLCVEDFLKEKAHQSTQQNQFANLAPNRNHSVLKTVNINKNLPNQFENMALKRKLKYGYLHPRITFKFAFDAIVIIALKVLCRFILITFDNVANSPEGNQKYEGIPTYGNGNSMNLLDFFHSNLRATL